MESLTLDNLIKKHCPMKPALIYGSQDGIIEEVSFKMVFKIASEMKSFLLQNIKDENNCIGLLMDKNILVPSIIISFQDLKHSFVFLTPKILADNTSNLNIKWILSVDMKPPIKDFCLEETLQLTIGEVELWKNNNFIKNNEQLNFKNIFCVVQTSGSTGESKTVCVPHCCIEKNVAALNKYFGVSNSDVIYWGTPLTFDPTLVELILGLSCQATLIILPKLVTLNPTLLYHALFKVTSVTFLQIVPSVFLRWSKQQISDILLKSSLKILAFGGEIFPKEIMSYKRKQVLKLFNLYGVTELSCWATVKDLSSHSFESEVPLGQALDETFVQIEDENEKVISDGVGEICIGSCTRYCLVNNDKIKLDSLYIVKTGDLGERKDGHLLYRGRKTRIIKRFGHKVTLHNIETIILNETGLQSRLVYSVNHKKLLAFILIQEYYNKNIKVRLLDKLRVRLLKTLPEFGFPDYLEVVTHFPLNTHGKISDRLLEAFYEKYLNHSIAKEHSDDIFIDVLSGYLKTELRGNMKQLGKHSFLELGGNSFLAIQFIETFKERLGNNVPGELVTLIINDSIQNCLNYVSKSVTSKKKLCEFTDAKEPKMIKVELEQHDYVVWKYNLKGCVDSTPLAFRCSDNTYIASGSFAHVFAIVSANGDEYLRLSLPQEIEAQPCLSNCGSFIFIGCTNGILYSLDLIQKKVIWMYQTLQKIRSSACVYKMSIVFGSYDGFAYCLAVKNGLLKWKTDLLGSIRANPIYDKNLHRIYIGTIRGMCYALDEENGCVIWSYKVDGPIFGSPCIVKDCTVWPCVIGKLYCVFPNGSIHWTLEVDKNIFSSLVGRGDALYFGCHDSYLYKVVMSDAEHKLYKIIKLESETSSSPFLYEYKSKQFVICVCNSGILYVIDESCYTVKFKMKLPAECFSSPYVFNNKVYIGCRDDCLYCINIEEVL